MGESGILDGPRPKHAQLAAILAAKVPQWQAHAAIPSERELMTTYGVSRATVREALRSLVEDGLLYRVHGKGTFVAPQRVETQLHLASFTDDMRRRGLLAATILQGVLLTTPPVEARAALGLRDDDQVWRVDRLRLAGGTPMAFERGYYPRPSCPTWTPTTSGPPCTRSSRITTRSRSTPPNRPSGHRRAKPSSRGT